MPIMTALAGVVPPLLVATILMLAAWRPWRRAPASEAARPWAAAGAIGISVAIAFPLVVQEISIPPLTAIGYLPFIGVAAALVGAGRSTWNKSALVRALVALVACEAAAYLILRPMLRHAWPGVDGWARIGGLGAAAALVWVLLTPLEGRGARTSLALWAASVAGAVLLLLGESASLSQAAGAVAVALGVVALVSWWKPALPVGVGAAGAWALVMGAILMGGHAYAGTPPGVAAVVVVLCSPLAAWAGRVGWVARRPGWQGTLATTALAATAGAIGVALAASAARA